MMKKFKILKVVGLFLLLSLAAVLIVRCGKEPLIVTPTQYAIDASTGLGGTFIPKVGKILVEKGKNQALTPKPDDGNEVESMIVDGEDVTKKLVNNTYTFTGVVSDHTAYATFKKIVVIMHNVEIIPTVGGTVTSNLSQVGDGLGVTFTFTSDSGFKPDSVIVNGKSFLLTGNTYSLTKITSDTKVKGVFVKTYSWNLFQGQWMLDSIYVRSTDGVTWNRSPLWGVSGEVQQVITFLPNGTYTSDKNQTGFLEEKGIGTWILDETTNPPSIYMGDLFSSGMKKFFSIEKLDEKQLIYADYKIESPVGGVWTTGAIKRVYSHH